MALPNPQSSGYTQNIRQNLRSKGIADSDISYNPNTGYVQVKGQNFIRPSKNYNGASYDTATNFNNAWSSFNQQQQKPQTQPMSDKTMPGYSGVAYGTGNTYTNNPNMQINQNINSYMRQQPQQQPPQYNVNPYDQQVASAIQALQQQVQNQQPLSLEQIYASPQYAAQQAAQDRVAQQAIRQAQESMGQSGFSRSTALAERAQGIQNQANEYLQTQILPQLIAQQESQRQQQLNNQLTMLQQLASQQGLYDTRHQQDLDQRAREAQLLGTYRPEGSDQIIGQLLGLKQQAEAQGITPQQRAALSGQADQLRAQLAGMGVDPALFGANVTAAQAGQNTGRAGIQTQAAREFDAQQAMQQEQFAYQKARDAIQDKQWQQKFDQDAQQFGLNYALQKLSQENDQAYRQAQLALSQDDNARQWAQLDAQLQNQTADTKGISGTVAADMLSQALRKQVGMDSATNQPIYGTYTDPTTREKMFVDVFNTSGVEPGADTIEMLTKAGYSPDEIKKLKQKYPQAFNAGGGTSGTVSTVNVPPQYAELIETNNRKYGLPDGFLAAVADAESDFNPRARNNNSGASGMFQFMPATAKGYGIDPFDPTQAADAAGKMLSGLIAKYDGDVSKALAAYNWGGGNLDKAIKKYGDNWIAHAPEETQKYINKILG